MIVFVCSSVKDLKVIFIYDVILFDEGELVIDDFLLWRLCICFLGLIVIDFMWCCFIIDDVLFVFLFCCLNFKFFIIWECY